MSLYTKGTWRRYHIDPEELKTGWDSFVASQRTMFTMSALAARATLLMAGEGIDSTVGINPPHAPRMDCGNTDQKIIDRYIAPHIAANLRDDSCAEPWMLPEGAEVPDEAMDVTEDAWAGSERDLMLYNRTAARVVGFWIVCFGVQDLEDKPSAREDKAASYVGMPYKLISTEDKKTLFGEEKFETMVSRKQCPVIIDLNSGDIWLGSGSTKFSKALLAIFARGMQILLMPGALTMGGTAAWVPLALNCIREKDIYRLEREEALEQELLAADEDDEDGDPADPDTAKRQKDATEAAGSRRALLMHLAQWAPDSGGESLVLFSDANVALSPESKSSVGTATGRDALELFQRHAKAELQSCAGSVDIMPPSMDDKGPYTHAGVDFSMELAEGIYRNLEFTGTRSVWNEILEEPYVRGLGVNVVVDSNLSDRDFAPRYSRYWFRYYLMLREFERHLIHGMALAMDLDPKLVKVQARQLFATQATEKASPVAATPAASVIESSFMDDIPEMDA